MARTKLEVPAGLSKEQARVLKAAQRKTSKKTGEVTLQSIYKALPALTENSIIRKVGKLVKGGFLQQVERGLYKVVA